MNTDPVMQGGGAAQGIEPRLVAARVLKEVLAGRSLSEAGARFLPKILHARDRSLAQELCYGVMRWYPRLDGLLRQLLKKPLKRKDLDVTALLLIGLYQMIYLRVADHAAVHETAGAAKRLRKNWAVALINGVLRAFQRRQDELLESLQGEAVTRYAMPDWLLQRIRHVWPEDWEARVAALNERPPMSLRVNCARTSRDSYLADLKQSGIEAIVVPFAHCAVVLPHPMDVDQLHGFKQGLVSVQDVGAQLAAQLLQLQPGQRVLDACAAPGGKTGHILESARELQVTAVDVDALRLERVRENLLRLGFEAELLQGDVSRPSGAWARHAYDRILLDVPCSATGVVRRHPDIKYLRRAEDIAPLVKRQGLILRAIWPLLRPGGVLLYATCSILPEENEGQVTDFLQAQADARELPIEAGWGEIRCVGRQIPPGDESMDGFYYARLQKTAS